MYTCMYMCVCVTKTKIAICIYSRLETPDHLTEAQTSSECLFFLNSNFCPPRSSYWTLGEK